MQKFRWFLPVLALIALISYARSDPAYRSVLVDGIPHVTQRPDFCGEACISMFLHKLESDISQEQIFDFSGVDPTKGRGMVTAEMKRMLEKLGTKPGPTWFSVPVDEKDTYLADYWNDLYEDLQNGVPSIVCMRYDEQPNTTEHFRLVIGYQAEDDTVIYHEPAHKTGHATKMKRTRFLSLWPLKYKKDRWTLIRMELHAPDKVEVPQTVKGPFRRADFAQHIMKLKEKLPSKDFSVYVQSPFVVIGDEAPGTVRKRSVRTVKWAVDRLRELYFDKPPKEILDIWLFKDKASYEENTWEIFDYRPNTPFGYYSPSEKALVMNIATGGGTLIHEIVHPFIRSNFPECPGWFNEGLASLYEQSSERDGNIVGLTNWRLKGLQKAIRADALPSFKALTDTTTREFYDEDPGTNYAQARYLCYYLQERDLLVKYYKSWVAAVKDDPTGYKTLQKILDVEDMDAWQEEWEEEMLELTFN